VIVPLGDGTAVAVSVLAWVVASLAIGRWAVSWPDERVEGVGPLTRIRAWERNGGWWIRHLRVLRWKDRLPEAGEFFAGGRSKRHLGSTRREGLVAFRRETIRAERVHWLLMATGPLHLAWCPPAVGAGMVAFGVVFDAPFIVVQRVNRGRIDRVLARHR
jgi:glycosyl-4,4'-diaponeurosporenoate acyltransferase